MVAETGTGSEALREVTVAIPGFLQGLPARIRILDASAKGHINADYIRFSSNAPPAFQVPVWGYADYHSHPMTYWAFGGINSEKDGRHVLWGYPGENSDAYDNDKTLVGTDIPDCTVGHGGGYLASAFIGEVQILPSILDFSIWKFLFPHPRGGGLK